MCWQTTSCVDNFSAIWKSNKREHGLYIISFEPLFWALSYSERLTYCMPNYKVAGAICKFGRNGKGGLKKCKRIRDVATQGGSCLSGESDIFIYCDPSNGNKNVMTQWGKWQHEAYCKETVYINSRIVAEYYTSRGCCVHKVDIDFKTKNSWDLNDLILFFVLKNWLLLAKNSVYCPIFAFSNL